MQAFEKEREKAQIYWGVFHDISLLHVKGS